MSINVNDKNLGHATAYAYYKAGGGTMTEAEFTEFMADFGTASQTAVEAAQAALASETAATTAATTATNKATEATTAATTATTKAGEASTSASTATSAKDTAVSASQTATTKATEATTAAATATSAKTDAVAANTAAQSAKTAAQTAQTGAETAAASVQSSTAQIATNTDDITQLKSELTALESDLYDVSTSINRYNSALVTSETISAGKQLTGTGVLIDNSNLYVSPYLEIEPSKTYTMGLVPKYGGALTPWYAASIAIAFYDESKNFVGRVDGSISSVATFTTPNSAKYYRFNIYRSAGLNLAVVNTRTMLVYGDALPESFYAYTGDSKTLKSDAPIHYSLDGGILTVTSGYGSSSISVEFGKRGPNNLPDFRFITASGRQKYNNSTDWFGPFVLEAINNIDGDTPSQGAYTGGNHNYNDTGSMDSTATARNINLFYYADGKSLSDGDSGFCSTVEIAWTNRVQAYNTKKADGTGREVLEERHTLKFNGAEWEAYTEIEALEALFCSQYYGMQCAVTQYPNIYMIGATYRKHFVYTDPHDSGNYDPNIYVAYDANDRLEMEVDRSVDLGKGTMYGASGTQGFRTSGSKGYTYFITQKNLAEGDVYGARGWYRFMPQY